MSCPSENGQPATSLPPLAHSQAEIDPGGLWGSGGGSILGVPEVPRGRWPLSSGEPLLTTGSGQRAYIIATHERCQDAARQHFPHSGPPQGPQRFLLSTCQPALASPPKAVPHPMSLSPGWFSHPPHPQSSSNASSPHAISFPQARPLSSWLGRNRGGWPLQRTLLPAEASP